MKTSKKLTPIQQRFVETRRVQMLRLNQAYIIRHPAKNNFELLVRFVKV